jgi:hypothetical protein
MTLWAYDRSVSLKALSQLSRAPPPCAVLQLSQAGLQLPFFPAGDTATHCIGPIGHEGFATLASRGQDSPQHLAPLGSARWVQPPCPSLCPFYFTDEETEAQRGIVLILTSLVWHTFQLHPILTTPCLQDRGQASCILEFLDTSPTPTPAILGFEFSAC